MKKIDKIREARLNKKRSRKNNLRKVKVKIKKLEEAENKSVEKNESQKFTKKSQISRQE